jgi:hypothetical protein
MYTEQVSATHSSFNGVHNISPSTFDAFARICNHDWHVWVLKEDLLDAAVISAWPPPWRSVLSQDIFFVNLANAMAEGRTW